MNKVTNPVPHISLIPCGTVSKITPSALKTLISEHLAATSDVEAVKQAAFLCRSLVATTPKPSFCASLFSSLLPQIPQNPLRLGQIQVSRHDSGLNFTHMGIDTTFTICSNQTSSSCGGSIFGHMPAPPQQKLFAQVRGRRQHAALQPAHFRKAARRPAVLAEVVLYINPGYFKETVDGIETRSPSWW